MILVSLFSLVFLPVFGLRDQFRDYAQCRNREGEIVDWWFAIKENGSMRYVYYDSKMALENSKANSPPKPFPVLLLVILLVFFTMF